MLATQIPYKQNNWDLLTALKCRIPPHPIEDNDVNSVSALVPTCVCQKSSRSSNILA